MKNLSRQLVVLVALLAGIATARPVPRLNPARFINEISTFGRQVPENGGIVFTGSSSITQWFNRTHSRTGRLWEDRFKSVIVEDGVAAKTISAYIHRGFNHAASQTGPMISAM